MSGRLLEPEDFDPDLEAELIYEREAEYNASLHDDDVYSLEEMAERELEWMWRE